MAPTRSARRARLTGRGGRAAVIAVVVLLAIAVACDAARARPRTDAVARPPSSRRVVAEANVARHVAADPVLAPVRLVAHGATLFVLDAAQGRVARWDDTVHWFSPRVSRAPHAVSGAAGVVGVLDARDARLTELDLRGRIVSRLGLAHVPTAFAACRFADGGWLLLSADAAEPLVRLERDGRVAWRRALPWPVVSEWPAALRQGVVAAWRGGCVVGMAFGPGWVVVEPDGRMPTVMPWRDPPLPPRRARVPLVADLAVRGDTAEVLVAGPTAEAFRTIDRYHLRTGAYLGAVRLPRPVRAMAAIPDGWGAIVPTPAGPRLARFRRTPSVGNRPGTG